ncbi:ATP-binding protein [Lichenicoccus sp.]|uniref:ATP-binding protein n=1 Tax=Lichenicoccus sp. TaxID=2781899 RepID=UPI003D0FEA78
MPLATDDRPDPDSLAQASLREARARLKIFLGAAPGVGKTYEMLVQARRRQAEGVDVVAGYIETHGRAETAAQIGTLPLLPRRHMPYRGQSLEEFDLDAALARQPALLLVDELAHRNAPGSRHARRWEDVAELLAAGIPVWTTLNIQHLESLNDSVARITGVRVSETLPDHVLELADEIELVDLSPGDLRARLAGGQVYRPDMAKRALDGFFREGNLQALREIALRRAAQHVDAGLLDYMRLNAIAGPWPAGERILALVGPNGGKAVVRHAKRLADALRAPWIALHVEGAGASGEEQQALVLAAELGAEIESRGGEGVARAALEVSRSRNVSQIVTGRSPAPRAALARLLRRDLATALLRLAPDYTLHVVPTAPGRPRRLAARKLGWLPWAVSTGLVGMVIGLGELFSMWLEHEALGMLFLAAVVAAASLYGLRIALFTAAISFLSWNFLFIPPLYKLTINEPRDAIAIVVFAGVASTTGILASRLRAAAHAAQSRIEGLRRIGAFSRAFGMARTEADLREEIVRQGALIAGAAIFLSAGDARSSVLSGTAAEAQDLLNIRSAYPPADTMDEGSWAAAHRAFSRGEPTGRGTATLPFAAWRFLPLRISRQEHDKGETHVLGLLGVQPAAPLDAPTLQTLETLAGQAAVALERVILTGSMAREAARDETQKLLTTLLNSLSHDLRTPLTGIRGSAETLRSAWDRLSVAVRADLLASIEEDTGRMTRFLANITEITRLESGAVAPRMARVQPVDLVSAALARLPHDDRVTVAAADRLPMVLADPLLLEQVVFNVLDNALRYAPGSPVQVGISLRGADVVLQVDDDGPGIASVDLPHVFESFYRSNAAGDRVTGGVGTGLGLAIARGLIEVMGGRIEAVSPRPGARPGHPGTRMALTLPMTR